MVVHRADVNSIQISHSFLRKPERLSIKQHLNACLALVSFIYQNTRSHLIFNQFQCRSILSEIDSRRLYLWFLAVSILCYDETSHTRKMPVFHLAERTGTQLNHLYHLVKMPAHFHTPVLGHLQGFVQHTVELLPSAVTQSRSQLARTPILLSAFRSLPNLFEV